MVENAEQLRHFTSPIASVNKPLAEGRQSIGCCLLQQGLGIGGYTDIVVHVWLAVRAVTSSSFATGVRINIPRESEGLRGHGRRRSSMHQ